MANQRYIFKQLCVFPVSWLYLIEPTRRYIARTGINKGYLIVCTRICGRWMGDFQTTNHFSVELVADITRRRAHCDEIN